MKKILYIIDTLQTGGAEKSLLEITSGFKKYQPIFIQLFKGDQLKPLFEKKGIEVIQFNLTPSYKFRQIARHILLEVNRIQPAVIHTTLFRADMTGRHLKKNVKVPLVNSFVNNSYSKDRYRHLNVVTKFKLLGIQLWDRWTATEVDLFISNSRTINETNRIALGVAERKTKVIYRGRTPDLYNTENFQSIEKLKTEIGVGNKKVFLNVSRLLDRKGQLNLIQAFDQVNQSNPETMLLIAGEGNYRFVLTNEIARLRLEKEVILLGNRGDVPALLQMADYFVFPSYYEGLPGALIEAMFAKLPIIASDIPENLECVTNGMAFLHQLRNIEDLANKMQQAVTFTGWDEFTNKAYQYAFEHFNIKKISAAYESAYDELTESK